MKVVELKRKNSLLADSYHGPLGFRSNSVAPFA